MNRGLKQLIKKQKRKIKEDRRRQLTSEIALEIRNFLSSNFIGQPISSIMNMKEPIINYLLQNTFKAGY